MTKTKANPLQAALSVVAETPEPAAPVEGKKAAKATPQTPERKVRARPDREATVMIGGHFPKSYKQQLRMIAAEEDTTSQALLEEALNLLFVKKGKGRII